MPSEVPAKRTPGRPRHLPLDEQRRQILDAARHVFAANDFNGTTIERIAREAGVTRPTVYEFFSNKEELFVAVSDDAGHRLTEAMQRRFQPVDTMSPRAFVRSSVALLFEFIEEQPDVAAIIRIVDYGGSGPAKQEVVVARHRIEDALVAVYEHGWRPAGGITHEAARLLASLTVAAVEAVGFRQPTEPSWETGATVDFLTDFIMGGLHQVGVASDASVSFGGSG